MTSSISDPVLRELRTKIALTSAEYCTAVNERESLRVSAPDPDEDDDVKQHYAESIREAQSQVDAKFNELQILRQKHEEYVK